MDVQVRYSLLTELTKYMEQAQRVRSSLRRLLVWPADLFRASHIGPDETYPSETTSDIVPRHFSIRKPSEPRTFHPQKIQRFRP